jgi:hypothetical protein
MPRQPKQEQPAGRHHPAPVPSSPPPRAGLAGRAFPLAAAIVALVVAAAAGCDFPPGTRSGTFGAVPAASGCEWWLGRGLGAAPTAAPLPAPAVSLHTDTAAVPPRTYPELTAIAQPTPLQRDLGFFEPAQMVQLEALIPVVDELGRLSARCAVCRIAALDAFATAVQLGLQTSDRIDSASEAAQQLRPTFNALCRRLEELKLLGQTPQRVQALRLLCDEVVAEPGRLTNLTVQAAELTVLVNTNSANVARGGKAAVPWAVATRVDALCAGACPDGGSCAFPLPGWPALLEVRSQPAA